MNQQVCAIVVTFNRKSLLRECLYALLGQTTRLDAVFVIDNASTDNTSSLFSGEFSGRDPIEVFRLERNLGGAGGFRHGLHLAHARGYEWLWLMDDDTIPSPNALETLLRAHASFAERTKPRMLASKVQWTDGSLHPMNLPTIKRAPMDPERTFAAAERATLSVRWASFVSLLIHRSVVSDFGLPFADYFIWNDDTEYTARVLRHDFGVVVPASVVTHKTAHKHSPMDAAPERAYYQARNVLWMILRSRAWQTDEKMKIGLIHAFWLFTYLRRARFRWVAVRAIGTGICHGLLNAPAG